MPSWTAGTSTQNPTCVKYNRAITGSGVKMMMSLASVPQLKPCFTCALFNVAFFTAKKRPKSRSGPCPTCFSPARSGRWQSRMASLRRSALPPCKRRAVTSHPAFPTVLGIKRWFSLLTFNKTFAAKLRSLTPAELIPCP